MKKIFLSEEQLGIIFAEGYAIDQLKNSEMINESMDDVIRYVKKALLAGATTSAIVAGLAYGAHLDKIQTEKLEAIVRRIQELDAKENKVPTYDATQIMTGDNAPIDVGLHLMDHLIRNGATIAGAAGIVGNWHHESRFAPDALGDHGHSFGLSQWNDRKASGYRAQEFAKYFGLKSLHDIKNIDVFRQADFAINQENLISKYLTGNETPEEAASVVCAKYERPKYGQPGQSVNKLRQNLAKSYYNYYLMQKEERS